MDSLLDTFQTPYIDAQILLAHLKDYQNPRDLLARLVKKRELIRLKNGFYLISRNFRKEFKEYPYEQIANLLYGPSYISLEWALSFYQLIPEKVTIITSVTTGSNKEFQTPVGTFTYRHVSCTRYSIDIQQKTVPG